MPFFQKDDGEVFEVSEDHAEQVLRVQGRYKEIDVIEGEVIVEPVAEPVQEAASEVVEEVLADVKPEADESKGKSRRSKGAN